MLLTATMLLLLIVALAFGFSRRPWWQIGLVALLGCGPLQLATLWTDGWRQQLGLSHGPKLDLNMSVQIVALLLFCSYSGYLLGLLYARWRGIDGF